MPTTIFSKTLLLSFTIIVCLSSCKRNDDTNQACNLHPELCNRQYNQVAYAATHNSQSYSPTFNALVANQNHNITQQLTDGIRCLNIDAYLLVNDPYCTDSGIYVIHAYPGLGCEPIAKVLGEIKTFLAANPREVLTITIEDTNLSIEQLNIVFEQANLKQYLYKGNTQNWATLAQMIDQNQRLVVFANIDNADSIAGFRKNWDYIVDTHYDAQSRADFSCNFYRGNANNALYLVNHFITTLSPNPDSAAVVNANPFLLNRLRNCQQQSGKLPNFVYVDFYDTGDLFAAIDSLNGVK